MQNILPAAVKIAVMLMWSAVDRKIITNGDGDGSIDSRRKF